MTTIRTTFAALALIAAGSTVQAIEAEQFVVPPSTLTRAEVRAELARAMAAGELRADAYVEQQPFAVAAAPVLRLREEVRREARAMASAPLDPLYVGG